MATVQGPAGDSSPPAHAKNRGLKTGLTPDIEPTLSPEDALARAESAARTAATITARPWWVDALHAVGVGTAVGTATARTTVAWVVAGVVFAITILAMVVAGRRTRRRRGRIVDLRPAVVPALVWWVGYAVIFVAGQIPAPGSWQPWWGIGVGLLVAGLAFLSLRVDERHQVRRLRAGDYGPYDLV